MPSDAEIEAATDALGKVTTMAKHYRREFARAALEAAEAVREREVVDAEARGYAAAREQAAETAETMSENWDCAPSVQAVAEAISKMEPNT